MASVAARNPVQAKECKSQSQLTRETLSPSQSVGARPPTACPLPCPNSCPSRPLPLSPAACPRDTRAHSGSPGQRPGSNPLPHAPARLTLESQYDGQAAQHEDVVDLLDVHLALHMLVRVHDRQAWEHPQHPAAAEVLRGLIEAAESAATAAWAAAAASTASRCNAAATHMACRMTLNAPLISAWDATTLVSVDTMNMGQNTGLGMAAGRGRCTPPNAARHRWRRNQHRPDRRTQALPSPTVPCPAVAGPGPAQHSHAQNTFR
jgi:hypothetical protein